MWPGGEAEAEPCAGSTGRALCRQCGNLLAEPCAGFCARDVGVNREGRRGHSGRRIPSGFLGPVSAEPCWPSLAPAVSPPRRPRALRHAAETPMQPSSDEGLVE